MGYRRKSRELALQMLFESEFYPEKTLVEQFNDFGVNFKVRSGILDFARTLFFGVKEHESDINKLLEHYSDHWKIHRMSFIDRNIIRLSLYELLFIKDIPPSVSIDEAIEIAKHYGSEDSAAFVNGLLDKIFKKEILAA